MPNIRKSITIYCRGWNASGQVKPFRRVLQNAVFMEQGNTIAARTGIVLNQSVFYQIFTDPELTYIPFSEWEKLIDPDHAGKWSIELGTTASFIVPFISNYEFNFGTMSTITTLENAWINANGGKRIAGIEDNRRGSKTAAHISIRC